MNRTFLPRRYQFSANDAMDAYRDILLLLVSIPVGAFALRLACRQALVDEPTFPRALAIVCIILLIGVPLGIGGRVAIDAATGGEPTLLVSGLAVLASLLVGMLI